MTHYSSDRSDDFLSEKSDMFSDSDSDVMNTPLKKIHQEKKKGVKKEEPKREETKKEEKKKTKINKEEIKKRKSRKEKPCAAIFKQYAQVFKKTSESMDPDSFKHLLRKTPTAVVLHHLHTLFHINRESEVNTSILVAFNTKFNVVSRYFLKALRNGRGSAAMESLNSVSRKLAKKTPLREIEDRHHFTPEFILMSTIQAGNMELHDKLVSEWDLVAGFKQSRDLVAAFFGIKSFFSDPSRYEDRQSLVISCICGGDVDTLTHFVKLTDDKWLSDYTMRKTREMCIPADAMLDYLEDKFGLKM